MLTFIVPGLVNSPHRPCKICIYHLVSHYHYFQPQYMQINKSYYVAATLSYFLDSVTFRFRLIILSLLLVCVCFLMQFSETLPVTLANVCDSQLALRYLSKLMICINVTGIDVHTFIVSLFRIGILFLKISNLNLYIYIFSFDLLSSLVLRSSIFYL